MDISDIDHSLTSPRSLLLLGQPVEHSLSPEFQNAALRNAGIDAVYEKREVRAEDLRKVVEELRRNRTAGNVTVPHKEAFYSLCDTLTPKAISTTAVNTYWFSEAGALVGHNTDVEGVKTAIAFLFGGIRKSDNQLSRALDSQMCIQAGIIGAGGSALATIEALKELGTNRINIFARTRKRAESLMARYSGLVRVVDTREELLTGSDLLVNATPVGLHDSAMPLSPDLITGGTRVLDLVYKRGETEWVKRCRDSGLVAEDGLRMLVEQGAAAFRCWFRQEPDRDSMWKALEPRSV